MPQLSSLSWLNLSFLILFINMFWVIQTIFTENNFFNYFFMEEKKFSFFMLF